MIHRFLGLDQIRAEVIAFNKPVVRTTKRSSKSNGSIDFYEILLECVFAMLDDPYFFSFDQIKAERMAFHNSIKS